MRTIVCRVAGLCLAVASLLAPAQSAAAGEGLKIEYERSEETNLLTLTIHGTAGPDEIVLSCKEGLVAVDGKAIEKTNTGQTMPCGAAYGTAPIPGPQAITVDGEAGNDRIDVSAATKAAGFAQLAGYQGTTELQIFGGPGADTEIGGPEGERFNAPEEEAPGGGDRIEGAGGRDEIAGTSEADVIFGGAGNDQIKPGGGADVVHGGPGNDGIDGEGVTSHGDRYYGDAGNDIMFGGFGNDYLNGGPGNDELGGAAGNDRLIGGPGKDLLNGEGGNDVLIGGPGRDFLDGGPGRNRLTQ
ncbi:MAG TPA: calcium-binding protein [Solirubrobacteraceae bacterium]|nr:calcium-binding protein [Solirubrobacteraceae bacterium]